MEINDTGVFGLNHEHRLVWGTCPVCKAKPGDSVAP